MSEEEIKCLNNCGFANVTQLLLAYVSLQQENSQLRDNWNKLKEYIKTEIPEDVFIDTEWFVSILDKMQELEQGSDGNGNN